MALVIEDGTVVANSNSYATRAEYIAWAATLGTTIADDAAADAELVKAAEYIDSHEVNMKGYRYSRDQSMTYPRNGVIIEGWAWGTNEIPRQLKQAQMAFAMDVHNSVDLFNQGGNPNLMAESERVEGAITVQYHIGNGTDGQKATYTSKGEAWLRMLLRQNGLQLVRA